MVLNFYHFRRFDADSLFRGIVFRGKFVLAYYIIYIYKRYNDNCRPIIVELYYSIEIHYHEFMFYFGYQHGISYITRNTIVTYYFM